MRQNDFRLPILLCVRVYLCVGSTVRWKRDGARSAAVVAIFFSVDLTANEFLTDDDRHFDISKIFTF